MALIPPATLSPSKVSSFKDCALAFRFSAIDKLPEAPTVAATRGSVVHLALEHLFERDPAHRTPSNAQADLVRAIDEFSDHEDLVGLGLDQDGAARFRTEAERLVANYFEIEDPTAIHPIGIELRLEAPVGGLRLRGIIDRLELNEQGDLVVTDYKTGRTPGPAHQQARLEGVHFYALLCEELFGVRPALVQLLYLGDRTAITTQPTEQATRALRRKVAAMWQAVEVACEREDFRPRVGPLCNWCSFHPYCPAQGGDPALAVAPAASPTTSAVTDRVALPDGPARSLSS